MLSLSDHFLHIYICQQTLIKNTLKTSTSPLLNKSKAYNTVWRQRNYSGYKSTFFQRWKSYFQQLLSKKQQWLIFQLQQNTEKCNGSLMITPRASGCERSAAWGQLMENRRYTGITALLRQQNKNFAPFMITNKILKALDAWRCTSRWQAAAVHNVLLPKLC